MKNRPKIPAPVAEFKTCGKCGEKKQIKAFLPSDSLFMEDKRLPYCNSCVKEFLKKYDFSWEVVDKLCMDINIPFIPKEFETARARAGDDAMLAYTELFKEEPYASLDWKTYHDEFKRLEEQDLLREQLPKIQDEELKRLQQTWGKYSLPELRRRQEIFDGIMRTQNLSGDLQVDQAYKIAKVSAMIDDKIDAGEDFDKLLKSYDTLIKIANFTPKNVKNAGDFESVGELIHWLEKSGWVNKVYDGVSRDIVDESMKNIQAYTRRLYINEDSIGDQVAARIEQLKFADELNFFDMTNVVMDDDAEYLEEGFALFEEDDEFKVEGP